MCAGHDRSLTLTKSLLSWGLTDHRCRLISHTQTGIQTDTDTEHHSVVGHPLPSTAGYCHAVTIRSRITSLVSPSGRSRLAVLLVCRTVAADALTNPARLPYCRCRRAD